MHIFLKDSIVPFDEVGKGIRVKDRAIIDNMLFAFRIAINVRNVEITIKKYFVTVWARDICNAHLYRVAQIVHLGTVTR